MHDEQSYLEHLESFDEDTIGNWKDFFLAFHRTMYPAAARYGMTFGEAILLFKLNQVYNQLVGSSKEDEENKYG